MSRKPRFSRARGLAVFSALLLVTTLAPPASVPARAEPGDVPVATAGRGPQQRGLPAEASRDTAVPDGKRPPVVPPGVRAGAEPVRISKAQLTGVQRAAPGDAFTDVLLRPGFVLGDTSLVVYFNLTDESFASWRVDLFDADSGTQQASVELGKDQLATSVCGQPRKYCKSLGGAEGWQLDADRDYFVTVTARYADGTEVTSAPSGQARPRTTVNPPAIPDRQAAGSGSSTALGMTDASQAIRAIGVNTGTGAFSRVEQDLAMASFGVPFASSRAYSSANTGPSAFGPGWAWVYDMRVSAAEGGAVVRAEDGAEVLYPLDGDAYVRPAGVRSSLRRTGTGWELVTRNNIGYGFDAQGRLTSILNPRQAGLRLAYTDTAVTVTDASGRQAMVKLAGGLIQSITLPDGRRVSYEYTNGLLTKVRDARGEVWKYRYTADGRLAQVVDPYEKNVLTNEYAATGRVARQTDALGNATTFEWDAGEQEAKTTDADNVVVWDGYRGNVLLYSQRGNGDTNNHRYDGTLNRNLVVNGKQNQHESRYDAAGNLIEQFAPDRRFSEKTTYDARNNPTSHVDANGETWTDRYNEFDELVSSTDAEKHTVSYSYDDRGLPLTVTDQRGKVSRYETIAAGLRNSGLVRATISPEGRRTEYTYDKTGRRTAVTDPRGLLPGARPQDYTTKVTYDEQDRPVATLDPGKRNAARTEFDAAGRKRRTTSPGGVVISYQYFDNGQLKATIEPRRTVLYTYTPAGRRATAAIDMKRAPDLVTSWAYNAKGLVQSVTSPRGNLPGATKADFTTTYVYDANDNPVQLRRPYPNGQVVTRDIAVDDLDRTVEKKDEFGAVSTFDRSNTGQVRGVTDNLNRTTGMSYDRNGRQTGITDAKGAQTRTEYDAAGNKIKSISPTGGVTTYEYTDDGLLAAVTEPRGNVEGADKERFTAHFEYDAAGNQIRGIDALDHVTTTRYDAVNRVVSATDAKNHTSHYTYNEDNQPRTVTGPDARFDADDPDEDSTVYSYGDDGSISSIRDARGHRTELDYDEAGRLIRSTDPLGRRTEATYDAEGNQLTSITLAEDEDNDDVSTKERARRTVVDTYDIVGRRVQRALGSEGPAYTWGYDAKDRTTAYGDPTGVRDVVYDDEDQIRSVTRKEADRPDEVFSYAYDQRGNVIARQYPDGTAVSVGYDAASRVTSLTAQAGSAGPSAASWSFGYDVAGNRTSTTLPGATGLVENRSYDPAGRLTAIGTERVGEAVPGVQDPVSRFDLTLDEVGNPTRVVTTRGGVAESVAYDYDKADRLTSACYAAASCTGQAKPAGRIDYKYDPVGNRTSQKRTGTAGDDVTEYTYDAGDQLVEEELEGRDHERETEYAYDVNGNQVRAGGDRFAYNLDNSLAKATVNGRTTTYAYGADGLRLTSTTSATGQPATTQRWSWDVAGTLPQIAIDTVEDGAGNTVEKRGFTYGPDDEPLALLDQATGAHAYTHDWLGGVATMLTPAGGREKGYDYDPFGNPRVGATLAGQDDPAGGLKNPVRFTGAYQDSTSGDGNYFMRARNYDPGTGRFPTRDPMPVGQASTSAYTYASNNPLAYTDPTGMVPDAGPTTTAGTTGTPVVTGPSPEDVAKANQLQSKSTLDVILEAGGQILMEFLGINDILNCLKGDLVACVSMVVGALPWGKIFKAKKIGEAIFRAGKAVVTFFQELKWAKAIISGAEKAAEAAKAAAAAAAKAAAEKAAAAKAAADAAAKKAAAEAAAKAKADAAKAAAKTKKGAGKTDEPTSCPVLPHSFVAGTPVLLDDGSTKPIEEVEPGDTVKATDPDTGKTEDRQVTHSIRTDDDKKFVDLTVSDSAGDHTITTTEHHPFWSVTRGRWVDAGELKPDELLRTAAGTYVQLGAVRAYPDGARTYDLTVDGVHTYYVVAGITSLLVHNINCPTLEEGLKKAAEAADRFEYPGMTGALYLPGLKNHVPLSSGSRNLYPNYTAPPGAGRFDHHLEAQSASAMRATGATEAHLFISGDYICGFCADNLAKMLPPGATLNVHFRNPAGVIKSVPFLGGPD